MKRSAKEEPKRVSASLGDAARALGAEGAVELAALRSAWPATAGELVAAHCQPAEVRNGCLTVVVDNPAWASEVRIFQGELLSRVRSVVPSVRRIMVQVSRLEGTGW